MTYNKKTSELDLPAQPSPNSSPVLLSKSLQESDLRDSGKIRWSLGGEDVLPLAGASRKEKDKLSKSLQENDLKSRRKSTTKTLEGDSSLRPDVSKTSRKSKNNLSRSLQENDLKSPRRKLSSHQSEENYSHSQEKSSKSGHSFSPILPARRSRIRKQSRNSLDEDYLCENDSSLANSGSFEPSDDRNFEQSSMPLHHSFSTIDDFRSKNKPSRLTVSTSAADLRAMQVRFDANLNSGSEPNLTSTPKGGLMGILNGLQSWFKERRGPKPGDKNAEASGDSSDSVVEEGSSDIHLYMILDDTVMLAYLRSTWDNCLLVS